MGATGNGGRHRRDRATRAPERDRNRHDGRPAARHTGGRSANPLIAASAAIVAVAGVTAASSVTAPPDGGTPVAPSRDVRSVDLTLAAASSPLNIPVNFAIDLINIPQYEVDGLNYEAAAFFYTGSWWVSNATNVWGTDPGDPPKYLGASMILLPNPWLSTLVGQTLSAIAIAELPVNATCGTTLCPPFVPWDTTGVFEAALGLKPFPVVNGFFTVPISALYTGYTFDEGAPGQQSFGGWVPTDPFGKEYPLPGTQTAADGSYLQPWAGQKVNLTDFTNEQWNDYVDHLQADPAQNPIKIPTGQDIGRAVTNLVASFVVAFDPFAPGMSYCPTCTWPKAITPEGIVGALSKADPGNTLLKAWLDNHGWQASQGGPGDPTPTPSAPPSPGAQQKTAGPTATLATSPPSGSNDIAPQRQPGRHEKPGPDPFAAIDAVFKPRPPAPTKEGADQPTGTTGTPPGGPTRSFTDRINDAVDKVLGRGGGDVTTPGKKPADGANSVGAKKSNDTGSTAGKSGADKSGADKSGADKPGRGNKGTRDGSNDKPGGGSGPGHTSRGSGG